MKIGGTFWNCWDIYFKQVLQSLNAILTAISSNHFFNSTLINTKHKKDAYCKLSSSGRKVAGFAHFITLTEGTSDALTIL